MPGFFTKDWQSCFPERAVKALRISISLPDDRMFPSEARKSGFASLRNCRGKGKGALSAAASTRWHLLHQLVQLHPLRLTAINDRLLNVRREQGQPQQPVEKLRLTCLCHQAADRYLLSSSIRTRPAYYN